MSETARHVPDEPHALPGERRPAQWTAANRDPLFLRDVEELAAAFASADAEVSQKARR